MAGLWKEAGPGAFAPRLIRAAVYRTLLARYDRAFDALLARTTAGRIPPESLGVAAPSARFAAEYAPTPVALFELMLASIRGPLQDFTFVDLGSGKGRILCLAACKPFRRVVGVEFSPALHEAAVANIAALRQSGRARARVVEPLLTDATTYALPSGPLVVYLYNPFSEPILFEVLAKLEAAIERHQQLIYVIYFNAQHRQLLAASPFLEPVSPSARCRLAIALASAHHLAIFRSRS